MGKLSTPYLTVTRMQEDHESEDDAISHARHLVDEGEKFVLVCKVVAVVRAEKSVAVERAEDITDESERVLRNP